MPQKVWDDEKIEA